MQIPDDPITFEWVVSLAMTTRTPCKPVAEQLRVGDPVSLRREPDNPHDERAIAVIDRHGQIAGYLYALDAGLLYLLLDRFPPTEDRSIVEAIISPGHSRRSPIIRVRLRLDLDTAASLFVLMAILAIKDETFLRRFDFQQNPWLQPLDELHRAYRRAPDEFCLPQNIVDAWSSDFRDASTGGSTHG